MSIEATSPTAASSRLKEMFKEYSAETALVLGGLAACAAIVIPVLHASNEQDAGIQASLTDIGSENIPGFESVEVDGTMINYNEGSLHGATVQLDSGEACSVQFTTVSTDSLWTLQPFDANIVSYGTCPFDSPTG